ncbi:MAG: large conductance mechanosensitive channel protein MscL [Clostridiales bacterium]|nr:large conductance mechanosensitive channel protein MscL [Clostridiales bacterium]
MKKFFREFKEFALKGNVLDLAIGVIIGAAFSDIVTSLTDNFINPILKFLTAGERYTLQDIGGFASNFLTAVVNFIIMAFILFCLVKGINKMMSIGKKHPDEEPAPTTKKCPFCYSEIDINATRCPHCTSIIENVDPLKASDEAAEEAK